MNPKDRLIEVRDRVVLAGRPVVMSCWFGQRSGWGEYRPAVSELDADAGYDAGQYEEVAGGDVENTPAEIIEGSCGTAGCLAGWLLILDADRRGVPLRDLLDPPNGEASDPDFAAGELLEEEEEGDCPLFYTYRWPRFGGPEVDGYTPTREQVVQAIDAYIDRRWPAEAAGEPA